MLTLLPPAGMMPGMTPPVQLTPEQQALNLAAKQAADKKRNDQLKKMVPAACIGLVLLSNLTAYALVGGEGNADGPDPNLQEPCCTEPDEGDMHNDGCTYPITCYGASGRSAPRKSTTASSAAATAATWRTERRSPRSAHRPTIESRSLGVRVSRRLAR